LIPDAFSCPEPLRTDGKIGLKLKVLTPQPGPTAAPLRVKGRGSRDGAFDNGYANVRAIDGERESSTRTKDDDDDSIARVVSTVQSCQEGTSPTKINGMKGMLMSGRGGLVASLLFLTNALTGAPLFEQTDVFVSGREGYFAYRIPAIGTAPDGSLLAFAEARKYGLGDPGFGKQDIDLVMKRSTDNGRRWSSMSLIEDPGERWSAANPVTLVDRETKRVWLFYLRCKPGRNTYTARAGTDDNQILARTSDDSGVTWSAPTDLTGVTRDMTDPKWRSSVAGPGGGIQTRDGHLVIPVWKFEPWGVFAVVSQDHGRTWQRGEMVPTVSGDECQLVELNDGSLLFDIRQQRGPHRWRAMSRDSGKTWSKPRAGESVSAVACAIERFSLKAAGDERDWLLWTGPKGPERSNLVVRVSEDEGVTFPHERPVWSGPAAYSDLTILKDKTAGVLWERGTNTPYEFISFTRFDSEWLKEVPRSTPK